MAGLFWYDRPLYDFLLEVPTAVLGWWVLRRSGKGPRWVTTGWALAIVLIVQTAFDIASARNAGQIKPSVCFPDAVGVANQRLVGGA